VIKGKTTFQVNRSCCPCAISSAVASPAWLELACATSSRLPARQLTRFLGLPDLAASELVLPSAVPRLEAEERLTAAPVHAAAKDKWACFTEVFHLGKCHFFRGQPLSESNRHLLAFDLQQELFAEPEPQCSIASVRGSYLAAGRASNTPLATLAVA